MARTVISPQYQVVIPEEICKEMGLRIGQVLRVIARNGVISLVPEEPLGNLRGFLKGMKTDGLRPKKDRL